jgi:hypothetical protein
MASWLKRIITHRLRPAGTLAPVGVNGRRLRPSCPICEKPMERRGSTVWMCPDFPRCRGTVAADD